MKASRPTGLSPHRAEVDLSPLDGATVLGEPLPLLFSALLRLQFGASRRGTTEVSATWTSEEGNACERAMARAEGPVPGDTRTEGQRDCDRFMAMAQRVLEAVDEQYRPRA